MQGLDPQDCLDLVKLLKQSARQLEQAGWQLNQRVARTSWQGPDSQRFRSQWPGQHAELKRSARAFEALAEVVLRNIADQERASAVAGGGLLDGAIDGAKDLWDDVTGGVGAAAGDAVDTVRDGLGWVADRISGNFTDAGGNFLNQLGHLGEMGLDGLTGKPPSLAGLVSQLVLTAGTGFNLSVTASHLGLANPHMFDDGSPKAGDPVPVDGATARRVRLPSSVSEIFGSVEDAYAMNGEPATPDGDIRILRVEQPDGTSAYIVNIPGTENWGITGSGAARDLTSNLLLVAGQSTTASQDVVLAMQKAGIPADAPVMLAGHSQGGMIAGQLASDPGFKSQFHVTNVLTAGSPIDIDSMDPNIKVLGAQHQHDIVPKFDLGGMDTQLQMPGSPPNITTVTMADPPRDVLGNALHYAPSPVGNLVQDVRDIANNHATGSYKSDLANTSGYPSVGDYGQDPSMRAFLSTDPTKVSAVDIPVGRQ